MSAEMRSQLGAYAIFRESARAAAAEGGLGGAAAAGVLGAEFDFQVAGVITRGEVPIASTPEEAVLGALPILSAALFVWFREHRPGPRMLPAVVLAAQATAFCHGGSFNLQDGLEGFLAAYATAYATDQAFNVTS